ncbi:MAG: zinc-ribbon domain-containing protein [Clostridia bacterium]|nr:zinc-ribbon domain-containing protein [Clostridia bacterium]
MLFCPNCGNEINDGALFCGNCGNKIQEQKKTNQLFKKGIKFDIKQVLNVIKEYFRHFYVDYNSRVFKFAMIFFIAFGIGDPLYQLTNKFLPKDIFELFSGASTVFSFSLCAILFGICSLFILKVKDNKEIVKKSNFLMSFWIVSVVLNFLVFLAGFNLYEYILYSYYASYIINILMVVSSALLIFKVKHKYPFVIMVLALLLALTNSSRFSIKFYIYNYKTHLALSTTSTDDVLNILCSLRYIIVVVLAFLLMYLIPRKISKWIVLVLATAIEVLAFARQFASFEIVDIIKEISLVATFVLFALSCSRKKTSDYAIENKEKTQKNAIKVGVASVSSLTIIVVVYLLVSAIVCGTQINSGLEKWKSQIIDGDLKDSKQWSSMSKDIFKYPSTKFVSPFVDDYDSYMTLKENCNSMESISECYSAYKDNKVDEDILETYSFISVNDSWASNSMLSGYYDKYLEMQPKIENVSASVYVDVERGKIEVTVTNNNKMPISKCTTNVNFTILFIESGYYSSIEYGRGEKTIEIEDIAGNSKKTETISFNPDDYYDSYGSYIVATLKDVRLEIISIE